MRSLWLAALLLSSCSLTVETDDLSGGAPRDAAVDTPDTCDESSCWSETAVMKLADLAPCSRTGGDTLACRAKIAERCRALDPCCYHGGFGPLEFPNDAEATVLCLSPASWVAPLSELTTANAKCTSSTLGSRACDAAAHASSKKRGKDSAVLQSGSGDSVAMIGLDADEIELRTTVPWTELTKLEPACTLATVDQQACSIAVHRLCTAPPDGDSNIAGFGPVEWDTANVTVVCLF